MSKNLKDVMGDFFMGGVEEGIGSLNQLRRGVATFEVKAIWELAT